MHIQFSARSINCLFAETPTENNYITLRSVYNPDWSMGFNRKGGAIGTHRKEVPSAHNASSTTTATDSSSSRQRQHKKCYQFVKRSLFHLSASSRSNSNGLT